MLQKYKNKILILIILLLFLLLTILLGLGIASLKVFELIPLGILLGVGYASYLKKIFPIKNIIVFIGIALFLGLFVNTYIIFLLGTLGVTLSLSFFLIYIVIALILNIFLYFHFLSEDILKQYVKNTKLEVIDYIWLGILGILFLMFTGKCLENYYFLWDGFTYWALDAKYIFENSHLRDGSFALLANNYIPFFSMQIDYVYLIYGKIVEQFAGLLSLIYGYTAVTIIFGYIVDVKKSLLKKVFLYLGILAALYAFFTIHYLLMSLYADVFLSVVVLIYSIVLFNKNYPKEEYWKRFILLVLLSVSVYLTKTHFFVFAIYMLAFLFIFDVKVLWNKVRNIAKDWRFILSLVILLITAGLIIRYSQILESKGESGFVESITSSIVISKTMLTNVKNIVKGLISNIPLVTVVAAIYLPLGFLIKKGFNKEDFVRILFLLLLVSFTVCIYIVGIYPLSDGSMYRYLGLAYLALPYLFIDILPDFEIKYRWQEVLATIVLMLGVILIIAQIGFHIGVDLKFTPVSGSYIDSEAHKDYEKITEQVESIVPKDSSIMVLSYGVGSQTLTDNIAPAFYLRYYLMDYIKNSSYYCAPNDCLPYFEAMHPDYLVIYSYNDYWSQCSGVFEEGKSYLVKFDFDENALKSGRCIALPEDVTTLSTL